MKLTKESTTISRIGRPAVDAAGRLAVSVVSAIRPSRRGRRSSGVFTLAAVVAGILAHAGPAEASSSADTWGGQDKALHFSVSAPFGTLGMVMAQRMGATAPVERVLWGALIGTVPGLTKELVDWRSQSGTASGKDLLANFAGALLGATLGECCIVRPTGRSDRIDGVIIERRIEF
jgi:uncharacterized protein YfiM (DUF2279 family)